LRKAKSGDIGPPGTVVLTPFANCTEPGSWQNWPAPPAPLLLLLLELLLLEALLLLLEVLLPPCPPVLCPSAFVVGRAPSPQAAIASPSDETASSRERSVRIRSE
jgi:hypothetical protein